MADTVEAIVRKLRGLCPLAPPLTVLEWVQQAYNHIAGGRPWSFLRGESSFTVKAPGGGTVNLTQADATVVGVGVVFAATDVGRQLRRDNELPYTIISVDLGANSAELDRPYGGLTGAAVTIVILDAFVTVPEDFARFIAVIDPAYQRQLILNITEEEANFYDPLRRITSQPRALISRSYSPVPADLGRAQYELYPYATSAANFPYYYVKAPAALGFNDYLQGPLRARTDVIFKGAILECCKWPGLGLTPDKVNPYFRISSDRLQMMLSEFLLEVAKLESRDEEIYSTWIEIVGISQYPFYGSPFASMDPRSTDASIAAL